MMPPKKPASSPTTSPMKGENSDATTPTKS
jgi:hypothetical protein